MTKVPTSTTSPLKREGRVRALAANEGGQSAYLRLDNVAERQAAPAKPRIGGQLVEHAGGHQIPRVVIEAPLLDLDGFPAPAHGDHAPVDDRSPKLLD